MISTKVKKLFSPLIFLIAGCAPGPPPPSLIHGFGWLIAGLVLWIGYLFLTKKDDANPTKKQYQDEILNSVNHRLKVLEDKIEEVEEILKKDKQKS